MKNPSLNPILGSVWQISYKFRESARKFMQQTLPVSLDYSEQQT
jgi:hypothetical protein